MNQFIKVHIFVIRLCKFRCGNVHKIYLALFCTSIFFVISPSRTEQFEALINQRKRHACAHYVIYISGTWAQVSIHYLAVMRAEISIKMFPHVSVII